MDQIWAYLQQFPLEHAVYVVCLAAVCLLAAKLILVFFDKFIKRSKIEIQVAKLIRIIIKVALLSTVLIIVFSSMGIPVSSLVATLSVVGVAFSLAIQDFLSNVFGGIQIISNKPFKPGDYVEAGDEAGTVIEVGLFYTKLNTPDKKLIQIPNSKIANDSIINYSSAKNRRLEFLVNVCYDNDVEKVREVLLDLVKSHPLVLSEEGLMPSVHVKEFRDNDVCYTARGWCENEDYWTVYFEIMDKIKPTLEKNGIAFSYPHVNVHMINK